MQPEILLFFLSISAELSVAHTNLQETSFHGYKIPKDSIIHANLYSSNMDTKYWESPEQFKPERFLRDGNITKNPALLPFSIGNERFVFQ